MDVNKKDIRGLFLNLDRKIYNSLNIKNKHFFGIASKLKSSDNKVRNFSDIDKAINDGEISIYDDRYNATWFHRIDSVFFKNSANSYGRSALKRVGIATGVTVFWAKRESVNLQNERFDLYQLDFLQMLLSVLSDLDYYTVNRIDFDINEIEKQEFNTNTLHKESILLRFNFELTFNPELCYESCQEWDCCPI
jgi:hypothetical protein